MKTSNFYDKFHLSLNCLIQGHKLYRIENRDYDQYNFRNSWIGPNAEAVVRRCSIEKVYLEISQNSQDNNCARIFFNNVAGLRPATLLKKRLWYRCFPVNFVKFLRTSVFTEHLW